MKQTINTTEIKSGDQVVGFSSKVSTVKIEKNQFGGTEVKVTFESGKTWNTNNHFQTTVIR